ncbi:type II toxin-antitoxin system PemK/MazF family toxin [Lachnospiraceae bacterium LCP25S3_G4]
MSKNYKKKYKPYRRGQVVYVDFGWKPEGVQCFIRPAVIVSSNQSNHNNAPQITVCPLSSKLKDIDVHVQIHPLDVGGLHLQKISDFIPEDIQTVPKSFVRGSIGNITVASGVMHKIDRALIKQLGLTDIVQRMIREALEHAKKDER